MTKEQEVSTNIANNNVSINCKINQINNNHIVSISPTKSSWMTDYHLNIFFPTLLVIIGWRILYLNAKKLATRTESKAILDSIIKIYEEIDKLVVDFWLGDLTEQDPESYLMIIMAKFETLNNRTNDLHSRNVDIDKSALNEYYSALTLNCEYRNSITQSECTVLAQNILNTSRQNISNLYINYSKTYKPTYNIIKNFLHS
ncbi:MAG: hypothetical protein ACTJIB_00480 [Pseudoalteromonas prydzensis]|uniref:Uncharacterized protein n=1 Tax=Pseudoalteromonas prydzensis TaxID=182141 RepID=A0ABR9FH98_9GAMM|nr:hypothetical protein [Pseudoalteromonas prydzensis]MBE0456196.1 hypothetical protein [Pseudoalteromonas prydzensis]